MDNEKEHCLQLEHHLEAERLSSGLTSQKYDEDDDLILNVNTITSSNDDERHLDFQNPGESFCVMYEQHIQQRHDSHRDLAQFRAR